MAASGPYADSFSMSVLRIDRILETAKFWRPNKCLALIGKEDG